jgi:hypothetical protein
MATQAVSICQHIKANGLRCGSPAMNHSAFCFFHTDSRLRRRHKRIPLPIVEDANSVQLALNQVAARIMDESIDLKRSGQLLYFLQLSSQNIMNTKFEQILSSLRASLAREYTPAMEAEIQASTSGLAKTPATKADLAEMYRYRDELLRQQEAGSGVRVAADSPSVASPQPSGKKEPESATDKSRSSQMVHL